MVDTRRLRYLASNMDARRSDWGDAVREAADGAEKDAQLIMNQAAELGRLTNTLTEVADWLDNGHTNTGLNARQKALELREMATRVRSVLAAPPAMPSAEVSRLRKLLYEIYDEDCGLYVWDLPENADIVNYAKARRGDDYSPTQQKGHTDER